MDLAKFFVAISISFFLTLFVSSTVSTFYKSPETNTLSCYSSDSLSSSSDCYSICEKNYNYSCYSSKEYKDCINQTAIERQSCIEKEYSKTKTYSTIYYLILAILGIIFIVGGFYIINKESIGAGFIGGGTLISIFAGLFASLSIFTQSLSSGLSSSLLGFAISNSNKTPVLSYIQIIFYFIGLIVLIIFANSKLEKQTQ
jgi:hypothetical protein